MRTIISYNERELKQNGSRNDFKAGYNVWIDLVNPTAEELSSIQQSFGLDKMALQEFLEQIKKAVE